MYEVKYCTVREWYLRMLLSKALKYDILMDADSRINIDCDDFYGELYRGLTGEELPIPNETINHLNHLKRVDLVNAKIAEQIDETVEKLHSIAKKDGFE